MSLGAFGLLAIIAVAGATPISTYDQRQEGKINVQIDVKDVQIVALVDSDILEDYTNYDYAYDYADFTIKPSSRPTTSKPSTSTVDTLDSSTTDASSSSSISDTSASSTSSDSLSSTETTSSTILDGETSATNSIDSSSTSNSDTTISITTPKGNLVTGSDESKIAEAVSNANKLEEEKQKLQQHSGESSTTSSSNASNEEKLDGIKRPMGIAEPRKRCPVGFLLKSGRCFKRRLPLISPRFTLMKLAPTLLGKMKVLNGNLAAESS